MVQRRDLFDFMIKQVNNTAALHGDQTPQAFGRWFANMYFGQDSKVTITDAAGDGKVDLCVTTTRGAEVTYSILNTKFTKHYERSSPVSFYDEITRYWQAFENKANRNEYLATVRQELHPRFKDLFRLYDNGHAELYFVTDHSVNLKQVASVAKLGVTIIHLDELLQYVAEHLEGAMPETDPLLLTGVTNVLTPPTNESEVPTSIVFARLIDFINYMEQDPFDLLFARNVRLWLGKGTEANKAIAETFRNAPKEFAYSNNGITILCKKHTHNPGKQELTLENPRVVNGSQTLHSIRDVTSPSRLARAMVRIIEIPAPTGSDLPAHTARRKAIIHKISIRSNLQNPIKRWNLVSNDDFNTSLARYFWDRKLYYERRQGEAKLRRTELREVGIRPGPDVRWMMQLIASYHHKLTGLGPAVAHGKLNALFEEGPYETIRETPLPLAYQLYLIGDIVDKVLGGLAKKRQYIKQLRGHIDLCCFSIIATGLRNGATKLGSERASSALEEVRSQDPMAWEPIVRSVVDIVRNDFQQTRDKLLKREGRELTPAVYVKNATAVKGLLARPLPSPLSRDLRNALTIG